MAFLRDNFIIHKFLNMWPSDPLVLRIYPKNILGLQKFMQKESCVFYNIKKLEANIQH